MRLYVETRVRADPDLVWDRTQDTAQHERWDLRFTRIHPLPAVADAGEQRFRYAVRVLPGLLTVDGVGVNAGERDRPDGTRTSALRFASDHPLSLIAEGSGYWRYVPDGDGVRFLTGYDYAPRWGAVGRVVDRFAFRPLMGWGTAWSFDRLRLWCERDLSPARTLRTALADAGVRIAVVVAVAAVLRTRRGGRSPAAVAPTRAGRRRGGGRTVAAAWLRAVLVVATGTAAACAPAWPTRPSARRCLRRPPQDRLGPVGAQGRLGPAGSEQRPEPEPDRAPAILDRLGAAR